MSRQPASNDDAINQLYLTIKAKFEKDGIIQDIRCLLQSKMVEMMRTPNDGHTDGHTLLSKPGDRDNDEVDARVAVLNQLIMEYFHWHNYSYTAEMYEIESATENIRPRREYLEGVLGTFEHRNLPILLQIVAELMLEQSKKKSLV